MSKGYLAIVQNSKHDYLRMAYALALSIASSQKSVRKMSIAIDKNVIIPDKYKAIFDNIIDIPFNDDAELEEWKVHNKWKYYHMTPYDHTVILDADMLFTSDVGHWWEHLTQREMTAPADVYSYRNEKIIDRNYRQTFIANKLPNVYTAFFHFNKNSDMAEEFFKLVEYIFRYYDTFKQDFLVPPRQAWTSADVIYAMAIKILGIEDNVINNNMTYPTFTHMKTKLQDWPSGWSESWTKHIHTDFNNNCQLKVGNYVQKLPFHYHDKDFLTDKIITKLERKLGI
tara:strand:+ start:105 stop:956 length:852 start_codon:yes stop_codon:yes gene_type:complete